MPTLKSRIGQLLLPLLPVNRRAFDIVRHELRAWNRRTLNAVNPLYHANVRELRARRELSVNIGSGGKGLPDWINIELVRMRDTSLCLDVRRPLPLADGSVARILAEHVVEHMDIRADIPGVFKDWHRVLRQGGVLRIIVPCGQRFLAAYVSADRQQWRALGWDPDALPDDLPTPMHVVNHVFHQGGEHLFAYDFEALALALRRAGFGIVEEMSYGRSRDEKLAIDQANHAPYSLYVEAVKT